MSGLQLCFYLLGNTNWEQCYDGRARKPHLSSSSGSFPPGISKMESLAVWYPDINSNIHQYDLQALGQKINKKVFLASDLSCNNCLEPALLCIVLQVICTSVHLPCDICSEPSPICICVQKSYGTHGLAPGTRAWGGTWAEFIPCRLFNCSWMDLLFAADCLSKEFTCLTVAVKE